MALAVRPIFGLYAYIFEFYVHPPSRWWGTELAGVRWSLVAAIVTLIAVFVHKKTSASSISWYENGLGKALLLYVIWMWIQWPWVISPWQLDGAILYTKYLILFYLIFTLIETEVDFFGFSLAHVLGCAYLGWLIYVAADTGRLESVGGPGIGNANTLAMHLGTGLVFASFLLLAGKGWRKWSMLIAIPFILNGVIQTETRGALVGLFLGGVVTTFLKPKRYRKLYYALAVVGIIGFVGIANDAFIKRMSTLGAVVDSEQEIDNSAQTRVEIVKAQLKMFVDHPLGTGHQGTAVLSSGYMDSNWLADDSGSRASHNTVMTVLVDQGLPGIFLFMFIGISTISILRSLKSLDLEGASDRFGLFRAMVGGSLATIFGAGMFAQYFKAEVQIWCLALLAVLVRMAQELTVDHGTSDQDLLVTNPKRPPRRV